MVIDVHQHLVDYQWFAPGYREYALSVRPDFFGSFRERYNQPAEVDRMLEKAGVDYAVVLAEDAPITTGVASTEQVVDFCRQTKRLLPFASINPLTVTNLAQKLEHDVRELGCRGVKLYPSYQYFYPSDPMLYPLYAKAVELRIPVTVHTGSSVFAGARMKYAQPLFLDDVAVDFPDLAILIAHGGRPLWYDQAAWLVRQHRNVYIDVASLPPKNLLKYFPDLERIAWKILFGSDWPAIPSSIEKNISEIRALKISEEAKEQILYKNAARILGIA